MSKRLNGNEIKWLAIIAMIIDHIAWAFVPTESFLAMLMHTIGKTTGPIMFFFIAEGYHYTKDSKKYAFRLLIFAVISELPYVLFLKNIGSQNYYSLNIMATLLCALMALYAYDKIEKPAIKYGIIFVLVAVTLKCDWSIYGVLIALCFGIFYGQPLLQWSSYAFVNAVKIIQTAIIHDTNRLFYMVPVIISPFLVFLVLNSYNGKRGGSKYSKWAFYAIYPVHLLILAMLKPLL